MLLYIQESKEKNAVDEATATVDEYVSSVVNNKRTVNAAMTFGHKLDCERRAGIAEGHAKGLSEGHAKGLSEGIAEGIAKGSHDATIIDIGKSVVMLKKSNISKSDAIGLLREEYPDYSEVIIEKLDELYN